MTGNGDGTFWSSRQVAVGPGLSGILTAGLREIAVADFNSDGIPDVAIPNFRSADISLLLGNGDGAFQPQRRFDALPSPDSLVTGDFNGDGKADLVVVQNFPQLGRRLAVRVHAGSRRRHLPAAGPVLDRLRPGGVPGPRRRLQRRRRAGLRRLQQERSQGEVLLGNGDGTFADGGTFATGENAFDARVVDINGDGKVDLVTTGTNSGNVTIMLGNGNGTFQRPEPFAARSPAAGDNVGVNGLALVDFGSPSDPFSGPDGHLDIVVTAASRSGVAPAEMILLPGWSMRRGISPASARGRSSRRSARPGKVAAADFNGDGGPGPGRHRQRRRAGRLRQADRLFPNNTPDAARDLGSVAHLVTIPQAIVPGHDDAYIRYSVPVEAAPGSGDQVIDFSALFQDVQGAGLQMEVRDAAGQVLGSGARFRVRAPQGTVLMVHVFGLPAEDGTRGSGVYTLDIDVLPQVVGRPGRVGAPRADRRPASSLRSRATVSTRRREDPANYTVTWFGPDGLAGTADDQVIPFAAAAGLAGPLQPRRQPRHRQRPDLSDGRRPDHHPPVLVSPCPPARTRSSSRRGSSRPRSAPTRCGSLAGDESFAGHPVVSARDGIIKNGASVVAANLVSRGRRARAMPARSRRGRSS